jgi:hypothetical protein
MIDNATTGLTRWQPVHNLQYLPVGTLHGTLTHNTTSRAALQSTESVGRQCFSSFYISDQRLSIIVEFCLFLIHAAAHNGQ